MNPEFVPRIGCPQVSVPRVLPQVCWQCQLLGSLDRGYLCLGEMVAAASPSKTGKKKKSGRKPRELLGTARLQVLPSGRSERLQIPR